MGSEYTPFFIRNFEIRNKALDVLDFPRLFLCFHGFRWFSWFLPRFPWLKIRKSRPWLNFTCFLFKNSSVYFRRPKKFAGPPVCQIIDSQLISSSSHQSINIDIRLINSSVHQPINIDIHSTHQLINSSIHRLIDSLPISSIALCSLHSPIAL